MGRLSHLPVPAVRNDKDGFFEQLLTGWKRAQFTKNFTERTVKRRIRTVMRFADFTGRYPWEWTPADADEFFDHLRGVNNVAQETARAYQSDLAQFCTFITSEYYEWNDTCLRLFGASMSQTRTRGTRQNVTRSLPQPNEAHPGGPQGRNWLLHGRRADDLDFPFAVTETGDPEAEPVIVLPGGPCRGPEYLSDLAGLDRTRRLIVQHPRGTPQSGGLSRGWWTDADDVIALADALDLDRVDLLAHSAGTRLALAAATRYPHRVRSLALVTPPAAWLTGTRHDGDSIVLDNTAPAVAEALRSLEKDDPTTEDAFREAFQRQAPATYAHWTEIEQAHANLGAVSLASALAWFNDIPADATDRIRTATFPQTLVIGGSHDYLTGIQPVVDYATTLGADLSMIEDCGHYPWIEQPDTFLRIADEWLSTVQSPRI